MAVHTVPEKQITPVHMHAYHAALSAAKKRTCQYDSSLMPRLPLAIWAKQAIVLENVGKRRGALLMHRLLTATTKS